jgi:hypothetical protein
METRGDAHKTIKMTGSINYASFQIRKALNTRIGHRPHEVSTGIAIMGYYSDIGAIKVFPHLPDHLAALLVGVVSH